MKWLFLLLMGICGVHAATHSLKYFYTAVSGVIDLPEFTAVGLVDDAEFMYFDSNIKRAVPKTEWMKREGADYWDRQTQGLIGTHQSFKANIQIAMDRFNQTKSTGVHTVQRMYGCEWDEETGATRGYEQYGYDGEDFISLDLENMRWIAPVQQAFITKLKWDQDRAFQAQKQHYFTQTCIDGLKKYVDYGKSNLKRTVSPSVSLFQRSPSSPVTCYATGFYPSRVMMFWRRDGEQMYEDVEHGEVLHNEDGTFQKSVELTVKPEDLDSGRYDCVVQLPGVQEDVVTRLVKTNHGNTGKTVPVTPPPKPPVTPPPLLQATHSLKYFYTAVSGGIDFPEFTAVGLVDDAEFVYFDSNTKRAVPKTEWIKREGADYWDSESQGFLGTHHIFKANIQIIMDRFNQSRSTGVHTVQRMYGCEWDEETGDTGGYEQYGYDGEDFISLDLENQRWIAPGYNAFITKQNWDQDRAELEHRKNYYHLECIDWLKKYVDYGKSTLKRTVSPSVSLLQKSPSSPVTCHATGFYPSRVMVFWRRDGEQMYEDVEHGEVLHNGDGTFQKRVKLTVKPEDLDSGTYDCVVQLPGVQEDVVTRLDRGSGVPTGPIIGGVVAVLLLVAHISGVVIWKKKKGDKKGFAQANTSDDGSNSSNNMVPKA